MINIKLNDHTAEDVKCIQELQAMGIPDEVIQRYYDMVYRPDCGERKDDGEEQTESLAGAV